MTTLELSPGNALAYDYRPAGQGGVTFVTVNALTGDKAMWTDGIAATVSGEGHGLLAYNLRGQAGSPFTLERITASDIIADLTALMAHVGPPRPVYVGLSIGGLFAAHAHLGGGPARAHGICFINTLRKDDQRLAWLSDGLVRAAQTGGLELVRDLFAPLLFNLDWLKANRANFLKDEAYAPLAEGDGSLLLLQAAASADWDLPYERLEVPVLNITGLQDRVFFERDNVDELLARIDNLTAIEMADAGHMIPAERPDALAAALLAFADEL